MSVVYKILFYTCTLYTHRKIPYKNSFLLFIDWFLFLCNMNKYAKKNIIEKFRQYQRKKIISLFVATICFVNGSQRVKTKKKHTTKVHESLRMFCWILKIVTLFAMEISCVLVVKSDDFSSNRDRERKNARRRERARQKNSISKCTQASRNDMYNPMWMSAMEIFLSFTRVACVCICACDERVWVWVWMCSDSIVCELGA